jgi:hypothetical protein
MRHMSSLNSLAGGLGNLILNWCTSNLGHSVAVLNLNWDSYDLGVVNTVLSSNLTTSMLDSSLDRVSNSMGNWCNWGNMVSSITSEELGISFSISLSFTLDITTITMITSSNRDSRSVTKGVNNQLAELLVFNFLGLNNFCGANILSRRNTSLGHENLHTGDTVGSRQHMASMIGCSQELRVSLSICVSGGGSIGHSQEARQSKELECMLLVICPGN